MIEIGQAVYFIESRGLDSVIKFGIVRDLWEDKGFYHYVVDFLSIKEHRCGIVLYVLGKAGGVC